VVFSPGLLFCGEEDFFISCFELFCNSDDDYSLQIGVMLKIRVQKIKKIMYRGFRF
jgi:hypothetical protein